MNTESPQNETLPAEAPRRNPAPQIKAGLKVRGLVPQTIEEAAYLAQRFFQSGMAPASYVVKHKVRDQNNNLVEEVDAASTQSRLLMGILKGMEVGLPPVAAISGIYIVNNRPTIYGDAALALVIDSGLCEGTPVETITGKEKTDEWTASCTVVRNGVTTTRTFTWAQAKLAKLSGKSGPWTDYPARQMQMRARAFALRDVFPDVLMGLGITEEVSDIQQQTPAQPQPEAQQDPFTMRALENNPAPTVDFSTLKPTKETVPVGESVQDAQTTPASQAPQGDAQTADLKEQDAPADAQDGGQAIDEGNTLTLSPSRKDKAFPGCAKCHGEGYVVIESVDADGVVDMKDVDCPECFKVEAPAEEKPKGKGQFDLTDLMNAG